MEGNKVFEHSKLTRFLPLFFMLGVYWRIWWGTVWPKMTTLKNQTIWCSRCSIQREVRKWWKSCLVKCFLEVDQLLGLGIFHGVSIFKFFFWGGYGGDSNWNQWCWFHLTRSSIRCTLCLANKADYPFQSIFCTHMYILYICTLNIHDYIYHQPISTIFLIHVLPHQLTLRVHLPKHFEATKL